MSCSVSGNVMEAFHPSSRGWTVHHNERVCGEKSERCVYAKWDPWECHITKVHSLWGTSGNLLRSGPVLPHIRHWGVGERHSGGDFSQTQDHAERPEYVSGFLGCRCKNNEQKSFCLCDNAFLKELDALKFFNKSCHVGYNVLELWLSFSGKNRYISCSWVRVKLNCTYRLVKRKSKIEQTKGAISEGYYQEMGAKISEEGRGCNYHYGGWIISLYSGWSTTK